MAPIRVGISHYLTPKLRPKDRWHCRKSIPPTAGPSESGVQGGNPNFGRNINKTLSYNKLGLLVPPALQIFRHSYGPAPKLSWAVLYRRVRVCLKMLVQKIGSLSLS